MSDATPLSALLPQNRTQLEGSLADAVGSRHPDERVLSRLYRPREITYSLLPWLAWSVDVLAWPRWATETGKRNITAESWRLHRLQGTLAGFKTIAQLVGSSVVSAITPPAKVFATNSLTKDERNAFVSRYPQLRIYPQRTTGQKVGAMLHCLHVGDREYPLQTDAALRLAPQAYLYRDGEETALQLVERHIHTERAVAHTMTDITMPGQAGKIGFCGRPVSWLAASDAVQRMYRLAVNEPYMDQSESLRQQTLSPGMGTITVRYDWIAGQGAEQGIHAGRFVARYLMPSTARERIYKRYWLFDPRINVSRQTACLHVGAGRLGMPAHHAEMQVRITGKMSAMTTRGHVTGYLCQGDRSRLLDALEAMRRVMRASDRIDIDTAIARPMLAGNALAGAAFAGQWQ